MSDNDTSYQAYWSNIEAIAEEIAAGMRDGTITDENERIAEEVDGSWWIIYTHANLAVLEHSEHEDAAFDGMGSEALAGCDSFGAVMARLAYFAMEADITDRLSRLDTDPADDDDDDDDDGPDEDPEEPIGGPMFDTAADVRASQDDLIAAERARLFARLFAGAGGAS